MRRLPLRGGVLRLALATVLFAAVATVPDAGAEPRPAATAPSYGVSPSLVEDSLNPGADKTVHKTVQTPSVPPQPDVVLLVDGTGSMSGAIGDVKAKLPLITQRVRDAQPDSQFAVATFRDRIEVPVYEVYQPLTDDLGRVQAGVDRLSASGGDDPDEDWIYALWHISNGAVDFRSGGTPIVVLVGDAPSHDPSGPLGDERSLTDTIAALKRAGIRVVAVNTTNSSGLGDQAADVAAATGGTLIDSIESPDEVAEAIAEGLTNLPITVTHRVESCDPGLSVALDPPSRTVTSGESAGFTERISVSPDARQGATLTCVVQFYLGNQSAASPADPNLRETIRIHVNDVTPPAVRVDDVTAEATGPDGARIDYTASAEDAVDGPLTPVCEPSSGSTFPIGTTTVTCTATDRAGNVGRDTAVFTVRDTTPPVVKVEDRTAEATGPDGARIDYTATAEDAVDGSRPTTCEPPSGSTFPVGSTTVICTATDKAGNVGRDEATFVVTDTTAPVVVVEDRTTEATGPDGAVIEYEATATDTVDGELEPTCVPPSGTMFPVGETVVTCTATDDAGNTGTGTAVFTVVDTTAPVVVVDDVTARATGPDGAVIEYPATAEDIVDGVLTPTCEPPSGSTFPIGTTEVTCTATDLAGNTGTDTATFVVVDAAVPTVVVDDVTVRATDDGGVKIDYIATAEDVVDGRLTPTCVPPSGSTFPIGTTRVTCTAEDSAGNTGTDTAIFTVLPPDAPVPLVADVGVTATVAPSPGFTGREVEATLTLTNSGPDTATGVVATTTWPGSPSLSPPSACTASAPCTIEAGRRTTVTQTAVYDTPVDQTLRAEVRGTLTDTEQANNAATARVRILQPKLTVHPGVATPGQVVLASGTDFPPGSTVTLTWSQGITAATAPVRVEADGTFAAQMLVLRKDRLGPRDLRAEGPGYDRLSVPVLVVQRHLQPPDFAGRG